MTYGKSFFVVNAMFLVMLLSGCSSHSLSSSYTRVKKASYNAVTDPVTWGGALGAAVVYGSDNDTKITNYFREKKLFSDSLYGEYERDDFMRTVNGIFTGATALAVNDDGNYTRKAKRFLVEGTTLTLARFGTDFIKNNTSKKSPNREHTDALASHHALEPFCGAAMIRRNVSQININTYAKMGVVAFNYYIVSYSALLRVQEGGHSFADQFVNASVGNFIGIFMHDLFMLDDTISFNIALAGSNKALQIQYRF